MVITIYYIFILYILHTNETASRQIEIQIHFCLQHLNLKRKEISFCKVFLIIHYTLNIFILIIHLSQFFFLMLIPQALTT